MKKNFLFSILFFLAANICFAQIDDTNQTIDHISHNKKTLIISIKDLTETAVSDLKDELIAWNEKVISIDILEKTNEFILVHNDLMNQKDLFDVLKKYTIKKEAILSYK